MFLMRQRRRWHFTHVFLMPCSVTWIRWKSPAPSQETRRLQGKHARHRLATHTDASRCGGFTPHTHVWAKLLTTREKVKLVQTHTHTLDTSQQRHFPVGLDSSSPKISPVSRFHVQHESRRQRTRRGFPAEKPSHVTGPNRADDGETRCFNQAESEGSARRTRTRMSSCLEVNLEAALRTWLQREASAAGFRFTSLILRTDRRRRGSTKEVEPEEGAEEEKGLDGEEGNRKRESG